MGGTELYSNDWNCTLTTGHSIHRFSHLLHCRQEESFQMLLDKCFYFWNDEIFTCGKINERLWWLCRKSDAHGPPNAIHIAHITRGHLTSHLRQLLGHLLSCRQKKIKVAQTNEALLFELVGWAGYTWQMSWLFPRSDFIFIFFAEKPEWLDKRWMKC